MSELKLGEVRAVKGKDIGRKSLNSFVWSACVLCGRERWVEIRMGKPRRIKCSSCATREYARKNGKGKIDRDGYVMLKLYPDDFFYPMARANGYVYKHRLNMAKHLGRVLHRWEIVHHKNGDKKDNGIENLELYGDDRHNQITLLRNRITYLETRIVSLEEGGRRYA